MFAFTFIMKSFQIIIINTIAEKIVTVDYAPGYI